MIFAYPGNESSELIYLCCATFMGSISIAVCITYTKGRSSL